MNEQNNQPIKPIKNYKTVWIIACFILIVVLIVAVVFVYILWKENQDLKKQLVLVEEPSSQIAEEIEEQPEAEYSLAHAIQLLPNPEQAVAGREISQGLYWVWVKIEHPDERIVRHAWKSEDQSWIVDVPNGEARLLSSHDFSVPYGPIVSHTGGSDKYFYVHWTWAYEGPFYEVKEYIDRKTGELAYSLALHNGVYIEVTAADKTLKIQLAPVDACQDNAAPPAKEVNVVGLDINGQTYPFPSPQLTDCVPVEMLSQGFYPEFRYFVFSEGDSVIRLGLPWESANVEIPVPSLDLSKLEYNNLPE